MPCAGCNRTENVTSGVGWAPGGRSVFQRRCGVRLPQVAIKTEGSCCFFAPSVTPDMVMTSYPRLHLEGPTQGVRGCSRSPFIQDRSAERDVYEQLRPTIIGCTSARKVTLVASMVVAGEDVRAFFHNGLLWLRAEKEANSRLPDRKCGLAKEMTAYIYGI